MKKEKRRKENKLSLTKKKGNDGKDGERTLVFARGNGFPHNVRKNFLLCWAAFLDVRADSAFL